MLIPLGPPLPDDAVAAVRGESGMLGALSVPLSWGVAVPPDDYDHWVKEPGKAAGLTASPPKRPQERPQHASTSGSGHSGVKGRPIAPSLGSKCPAQVA